MRLSQLVVGLSTIIGAIISIHLSLLDYPEVSFGLNLGVSLLLVIQGRQLAGHYSNMLIIFLVASTLYGVSGPFAVLFGDGLHPIFPTPYSVNDFNIHYAISVAGLSLGLLPVGRAARGTPRTVLPSFRFGVRLMFPVAIIFAVLASIMEFINAIRVGGLSNLLHGKAHYQSAVTALSGTLPSFDFLLVATALMGLGMGLLGSKRNFRSLLRPILWFLAGSAPMLVSFAILGRRGPLVSLVIVFILGLVFFEPIVRMRARWIALGLMLYLALGLLYATRAHIGPAIRTGDFTTVRTSLSRTETWANALNPASNEFAAPFGNFSTYILSERHDTRYGQTYLTGLVRWVPGSLWPGKPQSPTYDFRDEFFADLAERGRIASTGYSSILEAYVNFGTPGVLLVYLLLGRFFVWMERKRFRDPPLHFVLIYLIMAPKALSFHRSSFELPLWQILIAVAAASLFIVLGAMFRSNPRNVSYTRATILSDRDWRASS